MVAKLMIQFFAVYTIAKTGSGCFSRIVFQPCKCARMLHSDSKPRLIIIETMALTAIKKLKRMFAIHAS